MSKEKEVPEVDNTVEKIKIKKKPSMKKQTDLDGVTKVDLNLPVEEVAKVDLTEQPIEEVVEVKEEAPVAEPQEQENLVLEDITDEVEEVTSEVTEAITENIQTGKALPDNVEKLVSFMEETGGGIDDYVKLNKDYSEMDNLTLLKEYYKQTKPHLDAEEINFLMEDTFSFDEDTDDDRDIRRKKLALKEQVASAKTQLEENKSKYYEEIKLGSKLPEEAQKAMDFFNRYNKEEAEGKQKAEKQKTDFIDKTKKVFNDKFKGFEYNVGDKKFRFNVNNADEVKKTQGDINNFVKKFLNENNEVSDAKGYHKSLYTAMNADAIAKHFYEQGQADAMKNSVDNAKNIDMSPRQSHGVTTAGGMKIKVLGDSSADFKFKINKKNK